MAAKIIFLFIISCSTLIKGEDYCYADDENRYQNFGPLTSYDEVRDIKMKIPDCKPIYVWGLIKDGVRYMSKENIERTKKLYSIRDQIIKNHEEKRGKLCEKDLENLRAWDFNPEDKSDELTAQGIITPKYLARRLRNAFQSKGDILGSKSQTSYEFFSAKSNQYQETSLKLSNELYGTQTTDPKANNIVENDFLLQLNNYCLKWTEAMKSAEIKKEKDLFIASETTKKLIQEVSSRLGFKEENPLSFETIHMMYQSCGYENAWSVTNPAFCAAFLHQHLEILEYITDIEHFYKLGHGNANSDKLGCPIIKLLLSNMANAVENKDNKIKASFLITNSETITTTLVKLGLYRDGEFLKHDNFNTMKQNRLWKSSIVDAFSTNLFAVLYDCGTNKKEIGFLHNEKEIEIPECRGLCSLSFLNEKYKEVFQPNQCGSKFCTNDEQVKLTDTESNSKGFMIFNIDFLTYFILCISLFLFNIH